MQRLKKILKDWQQVVVKQQIYFKKPSSSSAVVKNLHKGFFKNSVLSCF